MNGSREFSVGRGVKQGDVLSTLLFNFVLDVAFQRFKANLTHEGLFISNNQARVTNIRYADDILLFSNSLEELVAMSEMLLRELNAIGLKLNAEKNKILHCDLVDEDADLGFIEINDELIEILDISKSHKYFGKTLSTSIGHSSNFNLRTESEWLGHAFASIRKSESIRPFY